MTTMQAVRIRPVPRSEPLTDEERRDPELAGACARPSVADRMPPPDLATGVRVRRGLGLRDGQTSAAGAVAEPSPETTAALAAPGLAPGQEGDAQPSPQSARELRLAARQLLAACIEVLGGFRPLAQLRPYCAPERFDAIVNRLIRPVGTGHGQGATRTSVLARAVTPPGPGRPRRTPPHDRVIIRRVQICDVMDGIAELAVVMSRRSHVWAMAVRMERSRGRWRCMHMEVL